MPAERRRLRSRKRWALLAPSLLALAFVFFGLDPLVRWRTREALKIFAPDYEVSFDRATLRPGRFEYRLTHLKVIRRSAGADVEPYLYLDEVRLGIAGRELLHRRLVAVMDLEQLKLNLIASKVRAAEQLELGIPDFFDRLAEVLPMPVDRVILKDAEVKFTDRSNPGFPKLWVHAIDGTIENLATRAALARGEPTSVAISGKLQRTGEVSLFLTADPLAKTLFFAGRATVQNFELNELRGLIASESGLTVDEGTLDLTAELDCRGGKLTGAIKPVLKHLKVVQGKPGARNAINAVLADAAVKLFSDRSSAGGAVSTLIPIRGDLQSPDLQLWPAIAGVIRNAFALGISETFQRLPPPDAVRPQGTLPPTPAAVSVATPARKS